MALTLTDKIEKSQYDFIKNMVYKHSGICLGHGRESLVLSRLNSRLKKLGLHSYEEYCELLKSSRYQNELSELINAISTNHTYFFREKNHYDFMVEHSIPEYIKRNTLKKPLKIWSAASSRGAEAYTTSITLHECQSTFPKLDWRIVCSDISISALHCAKNGVFPEGELRQMPPALKLKYFDKEIIARQEQYRAKPILKEGMLFYKQNLLELPLDFINCFDIVFCRNVLLYFDEQTQEKVMQALARSLTPGGYLFVGTSESLRNISHNLSYIEPSIYQKNQI